MKTSKEYCSFCKKEYKAKVWTKLFNKIALTKSHECKSQKKFYALKRKLA